MQQYVKNVILVMSGGVGARFGADCPKQYSYMMGRPIIDFVMDACKKSVQADEIVVVAGADYLEYISERFNVPVVAGGSSRPESVANGLEYVHRNYCCEKLVITNAVCPLATSQQYDRYFSLLDENDFVLTTWNLAPALGRFDGEKVDRDEFFNVMEPDAYNFPMLYGSFDFENLKKYILHNMPDGAKGYYCFDYPYTTKVTYPYDIPLIEVLYNSLILEPNREKTVQAVNSYLSASGDPHVAEWISRNQKRMQEEVVPKYRISSYEMNPQTEANIVFEAESEEYGSMIVKFTPSNFFFHKEQVYYQLASRDLMAELIDVDEEYNMIVLKTIKPGMQVKFDVDNPELRSFFDLVDETLVPLERLNGDTIVPNVKSEFEEYVEFADKFTFEHATRKNLEALARRTYEVYFEGAPLFYLHRDLHRRNILKSGNGIRAIDPRGAVGPREFEYVIQFIIEIREDWSCAEDRFWEMFSYFRKYCDDEKFFAALYYFIIYKINDYVFQKHDGFFLASHFLGLLKTLYYGGEDGVIDPERLPDFNAILQARREAVCRAVDVSSGSQSASGGAEVARAEISYV